MSYSWVDPHFAALYERREEQRLAEKLLAEARALAQRVPELGATASLSSGFGESDLPGSPHLRLI